MGGSAINERPLSVQLRAKYSTDYPDTTPMLRLQDPQGLTSDQVKELEQEISQLAESKIGEVRRGCNVGGVSCKPDKSCELG